MYLKLNGREYRCTGDERWLDLCVDDTDALGVRVGGRTFSLTDHVTEYALATTLSYDSEEGRRIYERSILLVFMTALRRVCPTAVARVSHSFGVGVFIQLTGVEPTEAFLTALDAQMRALTDADLPIRKKTVPLEDARTYFAANGQQDRLRILRHDDMPHYTLYSIEGYDTEDYFYGVMVPSTGRVDRFALRAVGEGLVLSYPHRSDPSRPAPYVERPKLLRTYTESAEWYEILGCEDAADLNDMTETGRLRELIRVSEALQARKLAAIADSFAASGARVILIAGPSSSGKTTFSHRLNVALRVLGLRPVKLSLDDYYLNRADMPREADGTIDFERIETLDLELLSRHLPALLAGETVETPMYDFHTGSRMEKTNAMCVEPGQPIIIEGIHALNDRLTATVPREMKFKVYISALTMLNLDGHNRIRTTDARLLRRIVRDNLFRGTLPEMTMSMWDSVRRGEEKYIFPFQEEADVMFNSTLAYELPIMKKHAYPLLMAVQPESPYYTLARRLTLFLKYIKTADVEDEIPCNSILREFIGGCCFYRDGE